MFNAVLANGRSAVARSNIARGTVRRFASGHDEAHAGVQMEKWKMYSKGMIGVVGVFSVYNLVLHFSHEHHEHDEDQVLPPYLKVRNKPFPWKYSDCNFFDYECKRKAKAAEQALE